MIARRLIVLLALVLLPSVAFAGESSVGTLPPVVVKTMPASGDRAVDPSLREIRVTFSKDMLTRDMWSWVFANPWPFPKTTGSARYLKDGRTCVLPVSLEPGRSYALWINSQEHNAFRDTSNHPAIPYLLVLETAGE